jgi:glycosyltransferase involved in cell wall biosynthesis
MTRIAVVVPCFAQAKYLPEAIASVRGQTYRDIEVVVVTGDGESTKAAAAFDVSVVFREPHGLADARNAGIAATTAPWILPLDADDVLEPQAIERLVAHVPVAKHWIVGSDVQEFGASSRRWRLPPWSGLREQNAMPYCSLFPQSLWEALGGYEGGPHEDWRFWLAARRLDPRVVQVHEPLLRYRRHPESLTATMDLAAGRAFVHARYPA